MSVLELAQKIYAQAKDYETELPPMPPFPTPPQGAAIAGWIDHTLLKPTATVDDIQKLCREAGEYHFAAVCVNPIYVSLVKQLLRGTEVQTCAVISFPLGAHLTEQKVAEARSVLQLGADEVDMVLNLGALKGGDYATVYYDIAAVAEAVHENGGQLKVILENAYLTRFEKIIACLLSKEAGADFVKTSTGFATSGATIEDVALMRRVVGAEVGVKAAGGIRNLSTAQAMIAAGANRIGASAGVTIVQEAKAV
jgi:deoxyribose-phosphate aldolase